MLTGTNLSYTKQYNLRIVHEVIRLYGPVSRAAIARRTELTVQTVSNLVKELLEYNLIYEVERRTAGRGAPSVALALNPEGAFSIGLDLDRDHLTGVLVDLSGQVRQRIHTEVDSPTPMEALDLMEEKVEVLIQQEGLPRNRVWGVGIGIPGPMRHSKDGKGYVANPKAFPGWHNIPLAGWLQERLDTPVFLENNATAAAIGERWYGAAQQIKTFFYVYMGSGLGGGIIMNGEPYEGFTGNAGEIGYFPGMTGSDPNGSEDAPHVGMHFKLTYLYDMLRATGTEVTRPEDLEQLLADRNACLLAWLDTAADHLAQLALAVEYVLDPEAIFFGGRLPDPLLEYLIARVGEQVTERRISGKIAAPRHLLATAGVDAAALGVATLPIYTVFAPAPQLLLKQGRAQAPGGLSTAPTAAVG